MTKRNRVMPRQPDYSVDDSFKSVPLIQRFKDVDQLVQSIFFCPCPCGVLNDILKSPSLAKPFIRQSSSSAYLHISHFLHVRFLFPVEFFNMHGLAAVRPDEPYSLRSVGFAL